MKSPTNLKQSANVQIVRNTDTQKTTVDTPHAPSAVAQITSPLTNQINARIHQSALSVQAIILKAETYKGCPIYKDLQRAKKTYTKSNFVPTNTRFNTTTVRDSHPLNDTHPIQLDRNSPTYEQATSGKSAINSTPSTGADLYSTITNFLEDFKSLRNPLISLLTKVIEKLLAK